MASTLWPGAAGPAARANLRTAIWALRKAVGDDALITSRTAVGLRPEAVTVDLADGLRRAADGDADAAAALCRGELLPGYAEDWAETARRRQRAELAETLADQDRGRRARRRRGRRGALVTATLRARAIERGGPRRPDPAAGRGRRPGRRPGRRARGHRPAARGAECGARAVAARGAGRGARSRRRTRRPIHAHQTNGKWGLTGPSGSRPLYGRAAELRTLMAAWTAARAGHGRVVLITGEAGIGKTRLVAELARRAENAGARTAIGAGVDVGGAAPLATWQELLPQLARDVPARRRTPTGRPNSAGWRRTSPPGWAATEPPPPVSSPELERLRVFDAVLRLVEWAAADRPVLLVAEDVHRADPASMQLCAHIGRRLAARPVLFVLTRRDKPDRPDADALLADLAGRGVEVAELELGPLAAVELAAVARSVADLTERAVDQVIRAADGNPLLAVESARALAAGRDAPPQNLRAAVRAAIGVLARPARDLAELLAAAGRELSAAELAAAYLNLALADRDAAEEGVLDTGLVIRVRGGLRFRHALLAEAVRADLGEQGRRYEQLALAIEAAAPAPEGGRRGGRPPAPGGPRRPGRAALAAGGPARPVAGRDAGGGPVLGRGGALRPGSRGPPAGAGRGLRLARPGRRLRARVAGGPRARPRGTAVGGLVPPRPGAPHDSVQPRASLAAYQRAAELLPADAPLRLRVDILLGTAWCESAAGDPARTADAGGPGGLAGHRAR